MALAGHEMARAARKSSSRAASDRRRCRGMLFGKPVRRVRVSGDLGPLVFLGAARCPYDAFWPYGGRLLLSGNVEGPIGQSRRACQRFLRAGLLRHEERSKCAHEGGDADGRIGTADHGGSPLLDVSWTEVGFPDEF